MATTILVQNTSDATNVTGMSDLLNLDGVENNVDVSSIERELIDGFATKVQRVDEAAKYEEEMNKLTKTFGISMGESGVDTYGSHNNGIDNDVFNFSPPKVNDSSNLSNKTDSLLKNLETSVYS